MKKNIYGASLIFAALTLCLSSCKSDATNGPGDTTNVPAPILAPAVSADSIYLFVEKQVAFGPRTMNSRAHENCAAWLDSTFRRFTPHVIVQQGRVTAHDKSEFDIKNIIASFNPENTRRIIICAHWDSRPYADEDKDPTKHKQPIDGANDGGSGVAVILELARQLSLKTPSIGVDLILWDAEDYGVADVNNSFCLGSQYWAKHKHKADYYAEFGINLDMVGAANPRFALEEVTMRSAEVQARKVWKTAADLGYSSMFVYDKDPGVIDDHLYLIQAGIPMVEIIDRKGGDGNFFPFWHTTGDTMDKISKETLGAVGQTMLEVIFREK